jgi:Tol biopolymer transport system component
VTRFAGELADEQNPAFSPDGRSVAYLRIMPSTRELVVQSLESSTAVTLVSRPYLNSAPLWTRDGTRVCYRAGNEIWCVGAVGGTPQKLLADVLTADFTPDGASLLFFPESLAQPRQLFVSSPPGATPRALEGMTFPKSVGPLPFVVSPDGTKLLVVTSSVIVTGIGLGDAWIVPYPLGVPMPLANPDHMQVTSARWLPDSRHVVLAEILPSAHSYRRIVIVDTQSADRRLIVQNSGISPSFAVSPDASRIIYTTGQPTDDIVEYSADGRRLRELAASPDPEINPVWAPSGDQFLYTVLKSGGDPSWWMRRADGSDAAVFAAHAVSGWPSYSPDGRRIAYATSSVASNTPGIETIPAQGGHPVRIVSSPAGERVCWSADGEWLWYYQNEKLWKVPSQGGQPVAIWDRDKTGPLLDCSADGRWIAYLFPHSVHLIAPDGTQDHVLTSLDGYTGFGQIGCFGPLGKNFYLLRNNFRALDVVDVATGKLRRTIEFELPAADRIGWFAVSPDEKRILAQTGGVWLDLWTAEGFALPAQGWKRWFMHWEIGRK